ncbi:MAG: hypothetical protein IJ558_12770 [Treponema sp.]|nr:hypothetical protein [Treponema sp.]
MHFCRFLLKQRSRKRSWSISAYSSGIDETLRHIESLTPAAHKKGLGLTVRTLTQTAVEKWIGEIMNENATLCYSKSYKQ